MDNNIAYWIGYYGATLFLGLCVLAALVAIGKRIWKMLRSKD
jgi:hypothetical protein